MKKFIFKNKLLINYITPLLLILVVPFAVSICFLQYTVDFAVSQSEERSYAEMNHIQEMVEFHLTGVRTKSLSIARNFNLLQLESYNSKNVDDVYRTTLLAREIGDMAGNYEFSFGCYVYDKSADIIFFNGKRYGSREFFDTYVGSGQFETWRSKLSKQYSFLCREGIGKLNSLSEYGVIEYTQSYPLGGESEGCIVYLLDKSILMNKNISNSESNLQLYIFNKNNELIHGHGSADDKMLTRILDISEGYSNIVGIGKALVSTSTSENGSLRYVCIDKGSTTFKVIKSISALIMIYALIILLLGGGLVFYSARQMSKRIKRIHNAIGSQKSVNDWQELMTSIEVMSKDRNTMKNLESNKNDIEKNMAFMSYLFDYSESGAHYEQILRKHGIVVDSEQYIPVIGILELDKDEQEELIKFALQNIFTDLIGTKTKWHFIDFGRNCIFFLLTGEFSKDDIQEVREIFKTESDYVFSIFNVLVDFEMGDVCEEFEKLRASALKLIERYRYRSVYGFMDDEVNLASGYTYLSNQENELISFVLSGDAQKTNRLIEDILSAHKRSPRVVANMMFNALMSTFFKCCDKVNKKDMIGVSDVENILFSSDFDETGKKIQGLYAQLCSMLTKNDSGNRFTTLSIKLVSYVDENYTNPNLSLKMLSAEFGITVSYISKIFKEQFGTNFSDYISAKRIEKAQELLRTTGLSISDIAIQLGYVDSSIFIKNFKKNTGITPGTYRNTGK